MRRPVAAALTLTLAIALAGCSSDGEAEPTPDASSSETTETDPQDAAALEAVAVEGDLGAAPTLTFDQPFAVTDAVARIDVEGSGAAIVEGDLLEIQYAAFSGDDGSLLGATWELDQPEAISLTDATIYPALVDALTGAPAGSRVLFAAPGSAATDTSEASPAVLMAIEVLRVLDKRAAGEAVTPADGLPMITLAEDGTPSVAFPDGYAAPTSLVVQPLIAGAGDVVESGQILTVQYSGWTLDGTQFDSSWANGAAFQTTIGTGSVITGWDQGLVGQTVGSQVLLVVPADLAYGGTESELAAETLVFVVDILHAS